MPSPTSERVASPVEMLRARVTYTETGFPAKLRDVEDCYGRRVSPTPDDGWFWIGASPRAAADIRRRGLKVVGGLTTSYIPADDGRPEDDVLVHGTREHIELMLAETGQGDGYYETEAPEEPAGPLRKVIVYRLRRAAS